MATTLNLTTVKYFLYKPWRQKGFFRIEISINVSGPSYHFLVDLNAYVMEIFKSFSAGIVSRRQNLALQTPDADV